MQGVHVKLNPRLAWQKQYSTRRIFYSTTNKLDCNVRNKVVQCYIWGIALYGVGTWTFLKVDQKRLASFEMCCWRRIVKISWTDRVRNEEVLQESEG